MSLTRSKNKMTDISPNLDSLNLKIEINGKNIKINSVQKVSEYTGSQKMYGFLIQTDLDDSTNKDYDIIRIIMTDKGNGDTGEAIYFKTKEKYK